MPDRLLQMMDEESDADTTQLMTPELADTIDALGSSDKGVVGKGKKGKKRKRRKKKTSTANWKPGMAVTPKIELVSLVAEGGMGSVWVAKHAGLKTQVAVKLVADEVLEKQPAIIDRLDREAATLAQLDNPNVVQIYEHGTTARGTPYIVMELLEGVTLWKLIKTHGALSLTETAAVVEQVAAGLSFAHGYGVIHRDIKPQNIFMFGRAGDLAVKVIDFGISKEMEVNAISSVTKSGVMVGTPHFMSPEQLLKPKAVDARTDLWSLGVVAYHCMTRKLPFDGETLAHLFNNITHGNYVPPSEHVPTLPPEVDHWVNRALAREPKDRFRTARELGITLKRIAVYFDQRAKEAKADTQRPPPPPKKKPPPTKKKKKDEKEEPPGPIIVSESLPPKRSKPPMPPPGADPRKADKRRMLPYPFALMVDDDESVVTDKPLGAEDRLKRLIGVAIVVVIIAVILVLLTR